MVENYKKRKRIKYLNQVKAKIIKDMKANKKKYEVNFYIFFIQYLIYNFNYKLFIYL